MTLRVGLIGAGNIFEKGYLPALSETEAVRVVAVCDLVLERAERAAAILGGTAETTTTAASVCSRADVDAVLVMTPTDTHADLAIAALEAGKHVLCEKPMARSSVDARRMAAAAERTGRRLLIGHSRRFDERWTTMYDQIVAGRIGSPVYAYRSEQAFNGSPAASWMWLDERSGGALWDVGIHVAELFHWFLGAVPETAFAKVLHARPESRAGGGPDAAIVTFGFGAERHAVLSVSWIHPRGWAPFYASTEVVGTTGRIEAYDRESHPATIVTDGLEVPRVSSLLSASATTFRREVEHFARAIETDGPFALTVDDAVIAVDMIEAAERSVRSGRPEPVQTGAVRT